MRGWKGEVAMQTAWLESSMLFILTGVEKNTCEIKGGNKQKQTKKRANICRVVNSVCPGERKLVGLLCGLACAALNSSPSSSHITRTQKPPCVIFGSCWVLSQRYWSLESEPQICWNTVGIVSRTDSIREIASVSGLGSQPSQRWKSNGNTK